MSVCGRVLPNRISFGAALRCSALVLVVAAVPARLSAQSANAGAETGAKSTSEALEAIDRLLEQNRRLEEQNQELVRQVTALRKALGAGTAPLIGVSSSPGNTPAEMPGPTAIGVPAPAPSTGAPTPAVMPVAASEQQQPAEPVNPSAPREEALASGENRERKDEGRGPPPLGAPGDQAMFGDWNPGAGFTVARTHLGELNISAYVVSRYLNQLPPTQSAVDHLGRPIPVRPRQDFQFHRVLLYTQGWLFSPKFNYVTVIWTVNDTTQVAVGGALFYEFNKRLTLGGGYTALPGTTSMLGSHPYWPTYDRVMADEFFRPFYTQGIFATGDLPGRLVYRFVVGNNLSLLGIPATELSRDLSIGGSLTWLPTTGEFGPRGAFGDYEEHEKLATRFNIAYTRSREPRFTPLDDAARNTTIRLADSLNVFDTGALAEGVTVEKVTYQMASASAGIKYRGLWLQGEGYARRLDNFVATGPLPVGVIRDFGFYAQGTYMAIPRTFELYGGTSYIFSDYGRPKEVFAGANYYPWHNRNARVNLYVTNVDHSPVNSTFGFYMGQLNGTIVAIGMTAFY